MQELRLFLLFASLVSLSILISYADRTNMAITIIPIAEELGWTERTSGLVLGAFFIGYSLTQIVGGWLSDRGDTGGLVLLVGVVLWSTVTALTPTVIRHHNWRGAIIARILLGAAEGVGFPACHSMLPARCATSTRLTAMVAVINTMSFVGGVVALVVSAPMAERIGWPAVFWVFGGVGVVWAVPWSLYLWFVDRRVVVRGVPVQIHNVEDQQLPMSPTTRRRNTRKLQSPLVDNNQPTPIQQWTIANMFKSKAFMAMFTCYYCYSWGFWMITTWLPTFLQQRFAVHLKDLGIASVVPYGMQGVTSMAAGFLFDAVVVKRHMMTVKQGRLTAQAIAMLIPAGCLLVLVSGAVTTKAMALVVLTVSMSTNALSTAGVGMNHLDLAPEQAGWVYGCLNTVGVVPGIVAVPLTGFILDRFGQRVGWWIVFVVAAAHYVFGWLVWFFFGAFERLE